MDNSGCTVPVRLHVSKRRGTLHMELGTASIVVQLLLIFVLVAVFTGRRHLRARRERRDQHPGAAGPRAPSAHAFHDPVTAAPQLVELPPVARRAAPASTAESLVSEELLPPCYADTCADWAQIEPMPVKASAAPNTQFSLADWSAPTDRVTLDQAPDAASLDWALDTRVEAPRPTRPVPIRSGVSSMSCTIAQPARHCA
jgi:hypothetical protein